MQWKTTLNTRHLQLAESFGVFEQPWQMLTIGALLLSLTADLLRNSTMAADNCSTDTQI